MKTTQIRIRLKDKERLEKIKVSSENVADVLERVINFYIIMTKKEGNNYEK